MHNEPHLLFLHRVHIMVGLQDKKHTEEEHMQTLQKNLQYAADLFRKENIVGVVEPKNNITFPGYFLNDFDKGEGGCGEGACQD